MKLGLSPEGTLVAQTERIEKVRHMISEDRKDDSRWSKASLCIFGDTLQPEEISRDLALQATNSGLKGERQSKYPRARPLRTSIWILDGPLDNHLPLQDHLEWLLGALEPKLDVVRRISRQFDAKISCGYSSEHGQGGCTFDAALIGRLANFEVPLVLDLYPPGPIILELDQA